MAADGPGGFGAPSGGAGRGVRAFEATLAQGETYTYEDPADAWIELVSACQEPDHTVRRQRVEACLARARGSQWTAELWESCLEADEDIEYGGPEGWEDLESAQGEVDMSED